MTSVRYPLGGESWANTETNGLNKQKHLSLVVRGEISFNNSKALFEERESQVNLRLDTDICALFWTFYIQMEK